MLFVGGPSGPMLLSQVAAIRPESIGPERPSHSKKKERVPWNALFGTEMAVLSMAILRPFPRTDVVS